MTTSESPQTTGLTEPKPYLAAPSAMTTHGRQKVRWGDVLNLAREHPGEWVKVPVPMNNSVMSHILNGRYRIDPAEVRLTTRSEGLPKGRTWIYLHTGPCQHDEPLCPVRL